MPPLSLPTTSNYPEQAGRDLSSGSYTGREWFLSLIYTTSTNKMEKSQTIKKWAGWWLPEVVGEVGEGGARVPVSSYVINKSWGFNVQHSDRS